MKGDKFYFSSSDSKHTIHDSPSIEGFIDWIGCQ